MKLAFRYEGFSDNFIVRCSAIFKRLGNTGLRYLWQLGNAYRKDHLFITHFMLLTITLFLLCSKVIRFDIEMLQKPIWWSVLFNKFHRMRLNENTRTARILLMYFIISQILLLEILKHLTFVWEWFSSLHAIQEA